jgi:hypothetical protein
VQRLTMLTTKLRDRFVPVYAAYETAMEASEEYRLAIFPTLARLTGSTSIVFSRWQRRSPSPDCPAHPLAI